MGVQKRKTSKGRRDRRRSHHKATTVLSIKCSKCGKETRPHTVCISCNNYNPERKEKSKKAKSE